MSLTRKEWIEVWDSCKRIERIINSVQNNATKRINVNLEIAKIKAKVEQVIGQME